MISRNETILSEARVRPIVTSGRKVVSAALFGDNPKYVSGASLLVQSVKKYMPGWSIVFFTGVSVPDSALTDLATLGASIISVTEAEDLSAASWRFRMDQLDNPDWVVFRDSDSVISPREADAVQLWVESGLDAHIIRDHPFHAAPIMGGLWGLSGRRKGWFVGELSSYNFSPEYGSDQEFLASRIYPKILDSAMIHASFHRHEKSAHIRNFRIGSDRIGSFCGESVTAPALLRIFARIRRLVSRKACNCVD